MRIEDPALLDEFRHAPRCEVCGQPTRTGADPHHVFARGMGDAFRLDIRENLIALDRRCHNQAHTGQIGQDALLAIIAQRQGTTAEALRLRILYLRRLPKGATP